MLGIIVSSLIGTAAFIGGKIGFGWGSGVLLGLVGLIAPYIIIARRVGRVVQASMKEIEKLIGNQQPERAIERIEQLRKIGPWQPYLSSSLDAQIGMLRYAHLRDFEGARPHLEKAAPFAWHAKVMLAALSFRKKQYEDMEKIFERSAKRSKKEGLVWGSYAWCEWKRGAKDRALAVLARGRKLLPKDERLARMQEAIQNGKKPKMKTFGPEWLTLMLEDVPQMPTRPGGGGPSMPPELLRRMRRQGMRAR